MTNTQVGGIAADKLRSYIERWERLEEQKRAIAEDQKDIMKAAKAEGFDPKAMKAIIAERKKDREEVEQFEETKDVYRHALGMIADLPLGEAAIERGAPKFSKMAGEYQVKKELGGGTLTVGTKADRTSFGREVGRKLVDIFAEGGASH